MCLKQDEWKNRIEVKKQCISNELNMSTRNADDKMWINQFTNTHGTLIYQTYQIY